MGNLPREFPGNYNISIYRFAPILYIKSPPLPLQFFAIPLKYKDILNPHFMVSFDVM